MSRPGLLHVRIESDGLKCLCYASLRRIHRSLSLRVASMLGVNPEATGLRSLQSKYSADGRLNHAGR